MIKEAMDNIINIYDKNKGHRWDPWGTLEVAVPVSELTQFIQILNLLLHRLTLPILIKSQLNVHSLIYLIIPCNRFYWTLCQFIVQVFSPNHESTLRSDYSENHVAQELFGLLLSWKCIYQVLEIFWEYTKLANRSIIRNHIFMTPFEYYHQKYRNIVIKGH